ncbi:MAG: dihydroorotase [Clostridiales Family XIII bacterium]|jgi:dihydroorotase|nr:dihydroorotase [Clostridiales Family XIII bacterium]
MNGKANGQRVLIRNGRVIDPKTGGDAVGDIYIEDGLIKAVIFADDGAEGGDFSGALVIDAEGLIAAPGLIDLHVHFREPGFCHKEDIYSGSLAAARGGYTTVCCMPNTRPAVDCAQTLMLVDSKGRDAGKVNLLAAGAMTVGQAGRELSDIAGMMSAATRCAEMCGRGVFALTEDGRTLTDEGLMRQVALKAKELGLLIMDHTENHSLSGDPVSTGQVSERLGIGGVPAMAEADIVARDIKLAAEIGCRIHIQHVSTKESIALIREAKAAGIPITAETAPHYFALTDAAVFMSGSNAKMNPPLRSEEDRAAVIRGLCEGVIDIIATDHAPHGWAEKAVGVEKAPFGISGLETGFAVSYTVLVKGGHMSLGALLCKMSLEPALLAGLSRGRIEAGAAADIVIIDIDEEYNVDKRDFISKGKNTPFDGMRLSGRVKFTICGGELTYGIS